jgi:hypothetical protein
MKLKAKGWARDHGSISLLSPDFENVATKERISKEEISINKIDSGVVIFWGEEYITLNGNYLLQLELSQKDIARIFVEAFSKTSTEDVLDLLNEAKKKIKLTT